MHIELLSAQLSFFKIYLFMIDVERERKREAETQEEGEAGSMPGAQCKTWACKMLGLQDHALGQRLVPNR